MRISGYLALGVMCVAACAQPQQQGSTAPARVVIDPAVYAAYDCNTLAAQDQGLRSALRDARQAQVDAWVGETFAIPVSAPSQADAATRLASLEGHHVAVGQSMRQRNCTDQLAGGVGSGSTWAMNPARAAKARRVGAAAGHVAATPTNAQYDASGARVIQPYPTGAGIAPPVAYTQSEIARFCDAGWETRPLGDGTVEYNPCFYR